MCNLRTLWPQLNLFEHKCRNIFFNVSDDENHLGMPNEKPNLFWCWSNCSVMNRPMQVTHTTELFLLWPSITLQVIGVATQGTVNILVKHWWGQNIISLLDSCHSNKVPVLLTRSPFLKMFCFMKKNFRTEKLSCLTTTTLVSCAGLNV